MLKARNTTCIKRFDSMIKLSSKPKTKIFATKLEGIVKKYKKTSIIQNISKNDIWTTS